MTSQRARTIRPEQHGTATGYFIGCRCPDCTAAHTTQKASWRRDKAYGRPRPGDRMPLEPTRQLLLQLREAGYTDTQIARLAGIPNQAVNRLRKPGGTYVTRETAHRVELAVQAAQRIPARDLLAERYLDATGARRRIRALLTQGWTQHDLAHHMGRTGGYLSPILYTDRSITPAVHQAVRDLYDQLWNTPGPSRSAGMRATAKGWPPPLFWDDDLIDDPTYDGERRYADDQRRRRGDSPTAERRHDAAQLLQRGWSKHSVAREIGVSVRTVERVLERQPDLRAAS